MPAACKAANGGVHGPRSRCTWMWRTSRPIWCRHLVRLPRRAARWGRNAWFLIVNGASARELLEGEFVPPSHRVVGASTAVFTALGMLAAYSWRLLSSAAEMGPALGAAGGGVILLGWLGSSGEGTDLVAHAMGFVVGTVLGALAALPTIDRALERVPQWLSGFAALACIAIAWAFAWAS